MEKRSDLLDAIGGEAGCMRLSAAFYAGVRADPILRPLFPGKSLKCAIEQFTAFLIQFLGGDEEQTQHRWELSLRESHARFRIGAAERRAWLNQMAATLQASSIDEATRKALQQFFEHSSGYLTRETTTRPENQELSARWDEQRALDDAVAAIAAGRDAEAIALAPRFVSRPSVFAGLLARMVRSCRSGLAAFVVNAVNRDSSLGTRCYGGRTLLHYASGAGCVEVVSSLLRQGADPDIPDALGHTPLYRAANECASKKGPEVVRALAGAGADVNACGGVTRATPLHMAARRGHVEIARALLDCGAAIGVRDRKGDTPLERAIHCRKDAVAKLLAEHGAGARSAIDATAKTVPAGRTSARRMRRSD